MKLFMIVILSGGVLFGQILYEEHFTGGAMQLQWHPWFTDSTGVGDSMQVISDPTTPGGDDWAGAISNEYMGVAGLTYAGIPSLDNYSIYAWIYTVVVAASGPYNGITMRMDQGTGYYYRLVSDFDSDARLRLGVFTGGMGATIIRDWSGGEIPGGVPSSSSWHEFKMTMIADSIWCYYDGVLLADCPFADNSLAQGYFGVYTFSMSEVVETKCDDIIVTAEGTGINEQDNLAPTDISVYPNPFNNAVNIRWQTFDDRSQFHIYDASGRLIRALPVNSQVNQVTWDGKDMAGNNVRPGVYFIRSEANDFTVKVVNLQ